MRKSVITVKLSRSAEIDHLVHLPLPPNVECKLPICTIFLFPTIYSIAMRAYNQHLQAAYD